MKDEVVTRFAPSPTGYLHIGGARTALFNWLYARHFGGKFRLRIEDTDRERSTQDAIDKIFEGLQWLHLNWDSGVIYQFARADLHRSVAYRLVTEGKAYLCYCTQEELEKMRQEALASGRSPKYNGMWRDRDPKNAPAGIRPVIRLKAQQDGSTVLHDLVQGDVSVDNKELDDLVLLRSDGTPTYMLSVVVDDHDMGITHVIRGDDHLTNTFRQMQIYEACGWKIPQFAHIPLIHGPDGAKLSKRHGALGIENYRDMGFLWETMCNYLLRLGWSHGNDEVISREEAIKWFDVDRVGRSSSRLDMAKLSNLNGQYIRTADNERLSNDVVPMIEKKYSRKLSDVEYSRVAHGMTGLKQRAKLLTDLAEMAEIYLDQSEAVECSNEEKVIIEAVVSELLKLNEWENDVLEKTLRTLAGKLELSFGKLAAPIRFIITGRKISPSIFDVMEVLGKHETLERLKSSIMSE